MPENSYTYKISSAQGNLLKEVLREKEFEFRYPVPAYSVFAAKRGKCSVQWYESGKLLIQGKDAHDFIEFTLEPRILKEARLGYDELYNPEMFEPHFGIDESGKGDFFGPLVVAGAYVDREKAHQLLQLGVRDSKRIKNDQKAIDLADEIKKLVPYEILTMSPRRYNELYRKFRNLNTMLAWCHGTVIANLSERLPECPRALSDQFAHPSLIQRELRKKNVGLELQQRTKAESDIAVAAASILARAEFVSRMQSLGEPFGGSLPKGASAKVKQTACEIMQSHGPQALADICKQHFKTYSEIVNELDLRE